MFRRFDHDHFFSQQGEITIMRDVFDFQSRRGILGHIADILVLTRYLRHFLITRNAAIKEAAETDEWQRYLPKS